MKPIISILLLLAVSFCQAQNNKWPGNLEQIASVNCSPCSTCTDTAGALYRHFIDAYTDKMSLSQGDSIGIFVGTKTDSLAGISDTIRIYRYGAVGWTLMDTSIVHSLVSYQSQTLLNPPTYYKTGAGWTKTTSVKIKSTWQTGFYSAQMTAKKNGKIYYGATPFVVKPSNPGSTSSILWVVPTNTYQAYNNWGGTSLYWTSLSTSIYSTDTVTFDRPYSSVIGGLPAKDSLGQFNEREWAWAQWMEIES